MHWTQRPRLHGVQRPSGGGPASSLGWGSEVSPPPPFPEFLRAHNRVSPFARAGMGSVPPTLGDSRDDAWSA